MNRETSNDASGRSSDSPASSAAQTSIEQRLELSWTTAISELGATPEDAQSEFEELLKLYSGPDRAYHNLVHLDSMLAFVQEQRSEVQNYSELVLAVFYHDAVYDSKASDNEERSAELAREQLLKLGVSEQDVTAVTELILSTKKHLPLREGLDNQIFLDADLAILGSSAEDYLKYSEAIREEYAWVPDRDYAAGRADVMEGFLKRDVIYFTPAARAALQDQAEENIRAEVERLRSSL